MAYMNVLQAELRERVFNRVMETTTIWLQTPDNSQ
jgi:hypothetical protein